MDALTEKVYRLKLKKNNDADIARLLNISEEEVAKIMREKLPFLKDLDVYDAHKTDLWKGAQKMALGSLMSKIPTASFKDLTYFLAISEDKINLREGRSTQNIGIGLNIRLEDLVNKKEQMVKSLKKEGVPDHLIAEKMGERLALPHEVSRLPVDKLIGKEKNTESAVFQDTLF